MTNCEYCGYWVEEGEECNCNATSLDCGCSIAVEPEFDTVAVRLCENHKRGWMDVNGETWDREGR